MTDQADTDVAPSPEEQRLEAARGALAEAQGRLPAGMQIPEPPHFQVTAQANALANVLLAKGIITEDEFIEAKTTALAELTEQLTEAVNELKRQIWAKAIAVSPGQQV